MSEELKAHRAATIARLREIYADGSSYGYLTQKQHALQAARQAQIAGAPEAVVVGALLHDVGWKLSRAAPAMESLTESGDPDSISMRPPEETCLAAQLGILSTCAIPEGADEAQVRAQHDVVGAEFVRISGLDETVAHIIEGHVLAKRFLCYDEADYYDKLSESSKRTLAFQGGPMTAAEAATFRLDPLFDACVEMRRWDEGAKEWAWAGVPDWQSYEGAIERCIIQLPTRPGERPGTFKREGNTIVGLVDDEACPVALAAWRPKIPQQPALRSPRATQLLAQWESRGYVVVRAAEWLTPEHLAALGKMADEVAALPYDGGTYGPFHTYEVDRVGDTVPSRTEAFVDHHPALKALLQGEASPLRAVVAHIAGRRVELYKDKLNYKAPGGGGYAPHQDGYHGLGVPQYVDASDRGMIAYVCMIAVDASSRANGCPELGWRRWQQKEGWVDIGAPVDDDVPLHPQDVGARDLPNGVDVGELDYELMGPYEPVEMGKGDVLIYDNYMPHRSGKNEAAEWRRALFGVYYEPDAVDGRDLRTEYYQHEAANRRKNGSARDDGRANRYHMGNPVLCAA